MLDYDQVSGKLTWKNQTHWRRVNGEEAGRIHSDGSVELIIDNKFYRAARIIWRMVTGDDPGEDEVDHEDLNNSNNAWLNLRLASRSENGSNRGLQSNNSTGIKGIWYCWTHFRWYAKVQKDGVYYSKGIAGLHSDGPPVALVEWVLKMREEKHAEFARH